VTGTIKKNIQTTTIYIFCVVWVLTVSKYINIRLKVRHFHEKSHGLYVGLTEYHGKYHGMSLGISHRVNGP
jgi:hypothetical protein